MQRLGLATSTDGQVSKRSALELLLWESVVEVLRGLPSGMISAARKHEDGKEGLLLTLDTLHTDNSRLPGLFRRHVRFFVDEIWSRSGIERKHKIKSSRL